MNVITSICSQLQCCWQVLTNFSPPPLHLPLLSLRLLTQPLANLQVNEHALASCPTCNCSFVCDLAYNYEFTCDPTCKCVPTCTCGYEFPPVFKHAPTYKNQRMIPSHQSCTTQDVCFFHNKIIAFFNRHDVNLTS